MIGAEISQGVDAPAGLRVPATDCTLRDARRYCRRLAHRHYENFVVSGLVLPRRLRQHFYHVYSYCRWADDLADEGASPEQRVERLNAWEEELRSCFAGQPSHPVFVALAETVTAFRLSAQPFHDLLVAFRRDQTQVRYASYEDLFDYCRHSANPVGRIVLELGDSSTEANRADSDRICTGLQLANFCQDVAEDHARGRIYVPLTNDDFSGALGSAWREGRATAEFRHRLAEMADRAEAFLRGGQTLIGRVDPSIAAAVRLFVAGGLEILEAIRRLDYDVWSSRPRVPRRTHVRQIADVLWRRQRGTLGDPLP